jgi:hypothetical protein
MAESYKVTSLLLTIYDCKKVYLSDYTLKVGNLAFPQIIDNGGNDWNLKVTKSLAYYGT